MSRHNSQRVGALSPEMALLGLLYGEPGHGYDLHRRVVTDLGQVWHLSQSQAYSILKRLEAQGDISVEEIPQEKLPPRQLLRQTPQGRQRFLDWLETPSGGSTRAIRMEFVTRLYFTDRYFPEKLAQLFDAQRSEIQKHLQRLEKVRAELPVDQFFNHLSLNLRLKQLRLVLDWLDESRSVFGV